MSGADKRAVSRTQRAFLSTNHQGVVLMSDPTIVDKEPYVRLSIMSASPNSGYDVMHLDPTEARTLAQRMLADADEADRRAHDGA